MGVLSTNEDGTQFNTFCGSDFITNDGISLRNLKNGLANVILNQSLPKGANIDDIVYPKTPFSCWVCFNNADHPQYITTGYNLSTNILFGCILFGRQFQIFCELGSMHIFLRINANNKWTDWQAMPNFSDLGTQASYSLSDTTLTITTK